MASPGCIEEKIKSQMRPCAPTRSVHTTHNFIVFVNQGMEAGQARLGYVCMVIGC